MWSRPAGASAILQIRGEWPELKTAPCAFWVPAVTEQGLRLLALLLPGLLSPLAQLAQRRLDHPLGRDAEVLVQVLIGSAGAETAHADKAAIAADDGVPALPHRGLDRDLDLGIADRRAAGRVRGRE